MKSTERVQGYEDLNSQIIGNNSNFGEIEEDIIT
jgi:hypothetical protein